MKKLESLNNEKFNVLTLEQAGQINGGWPRVTVLATTVRNCNDGVGQTFNITQTTTREHNFFFFHWGATLSTTGEELFANNDAC